MSKKIRLGIVDDHQIVIDGLVAMLQDHDRVIVEFVTTDPLAVLDLLQQHPVDIMITDVMMPGLPGNLLAKKIRENFPAVYILALSMSGETNTVDEMIRDASIAGYALKNISRNELFTAIEKIASGGIYFTPGLLESMEETVTSKKEAVPTTLTAREIEIVKLIEKELNNREIASTLFISERTVETHRKNIFRKTNTSSLIGLVKYAYQNNIVNRKV